MKTKILNVLRKSDGYVSGQALCNMLGVSRTAVWKVINQLKEEGYVIEAVQNKGYHITQYPDILTSSEIMSQLTCVDTGSTTGIIREVVYYDETDSTNNEAKRAAERDNAADGTLYITESQTGGRGRRGRNWVSPAGSGIWMSLLLRPDISPVNASIMKEHFADIVDLKFTNQMEEELDGIENGKAQWRDVLADFYGDFSKEMDEAEKAMDGVKLKVPDVLSDEYCDVCGRQMVVKKGRFGYFLACPGFPDCTFTKPIVVEMPGKCPKCGGRILKRTSKKGYVFYACERGTDCGFITWDVPTKDFCPACGKTMFKHSGRGPLKSFCINEQCPNFVPEDKRTFKKKTPEEKAQAAAEKAAKAAEKAAAAEGEEETKPARKTAAKKTAAAKTTAKKTATKTTAKKTTAKKATAAKKTSTKKSADTEE